VQNKRRTQHSFDTNSIEHQTQSNTASQPNAFHPPVRGENRKKNTGEIQNEFYCILSNLFKELQTSHFHHMFVIAYFKKSLNSTDFHLIHHFGAKALQLSFAQCSQFQGLELQMKSIEVWEGGRKVDVNFSRKNPWLVLVKGEFLSSYQSKMHF